VVRSKGGVKVGKEGKVGEADFGVAVPGVESAGQGKDRGRGRPSLMPWEKKPGKKSGQGSAKGKRSAGQGKPDKNNNNNSLDIYNINNMSIDDVNNLFNSDNPDFNSARSIGEQLTVKELKFLEIYLEGEVTQEKAMVLAGYKDYSESHLRFLASKIVKKYESGTGVGPKALRAVGFGELKIAMLLKTMAETAKSEIVRLEAVKFAANCLGMTKPDETYLGFSVAFNPPAAQVEGEKPVDLPAAVPVQVRAIQITR
jgi:hypothetical protein